MVVELVQMNLQKSGTVLEAFGSSWQGSWIKQGLILQDSTVSCYFLLEFTDFLQVHCQ